MRRSLLAISMTVALFSCQSETQSFGNPRQVVDALAEADIACRGLERKAPSAASPGFDTLAKARGVCRVRGHDVVITTFANARDRDDWVAVGQLLGPVAVGPDWVVTSSSPEVVSDVAAALNAGRSTRLRPN